MRQQAITSYKYLCINYNVLNFSVLPFPISQYTHRSKINKFTSNIDKEGDNIYFINKAENQNEYEKFLIIGKIKLIINSSCF